MHGIGQIALVAALGTLCVSCSSWWTQNTSQQEEAKKKTPPPLHLGAVHQVYPAQKFALLRIIGPIPSPGTTLITHPADGSTTRIGNLEVSENSKPRQGMVVADIRSGVVVSGDRVFLYRNIAPPEEGEQHSTSTTQQSDALPKPPPLHIRTTGTTDISPQADTQDTTQPEAPPVPIAEPSPIQTNPEVIDGPDTLPASSSPSHAKPDYLNDIPDDINEWN